MKSKKKKKNDKVFIFCLSFHQPPQGFPFGFWPARPPCSRTHKRAGQSNDAGCSKGCHSGRKTLQPKCQSDRVVLNHWK